MTPGETVRWWRKRGGWAFGTLTAIGPTWSRVRVGEGDYKRVRTDTLKPWPTAKEKP